MNISIDIGTSNSSIFYMDPAGEAQPVKISTGMSMYGNDYSLPSAVYVDKSGQVLVGQAAMNSRKQDPTRFRSEFKRNLGQEVPIVLGDRSMLPEEMYTEIFRHLKACAEKASGEAAGRAYVTHPAAFSQSKKQKVLEAANAAGLYDVVLLDEPTAAAMCYCADGKVKEGQTLLVYDFGGGTFDAALIRYENGAFHPLTDAVGLERCGGIDIDRLIYMDMFSAAGDALEASGHQQNRSAMIRFQATLSELATKAKCHLTTASSFDEGISMGFDYIDYSLTADKLNGMISSLIQQTIDCCQQILKNAGMTVADLDCILLVGGTSRVPLVEQMVRQFAKDVPVLANADPELVVAHGALLMEKLEETPAEEEDTTEDVQQPEEPEFIRPTPPPPPPPPVHRLLLEQKDIGKINALNPQALMEQVLGTLSLYTDELLFSTSGSALSELAKKRVKPGKVFSKLMDGSLIKDPSTFSFDELVEVSEVPDTVIKMPLHSIRSCGVHEFRVLLAPVYALCIQMHNDSFYRFVMSEKRATEFRRLIQSQTGL